EPSGQGKISLFRPTASRCAQSRRLSAPLFHLRLFLSMSLSLSLSLCCSGRRSYSAPPLPAEPNLGDTKPSFVVIGGSCCSNSSRSLPLRAAPTKRDGSASKRSRQVLEQK